MDWCFPRWDWRFVVYRRSDELDDESDNSFYYSRSFSPLHLVIARYDLLWSLVLDESA